MSLNTLLKIFKNSSIVNLTTEAVKPLLLLLNRNRSRRLYFRDCICQLQSQFKALVLLEYQARQQRGSRWARAGQVSGYYGVAMDTRGALVVSGQAMCQVTMELLCNKQINQAWR